MSSKDGSVHVRVRRGSIGAVLALYQTSLGAAGAPPFAGVCDRTRADDKVPSSEALAQLAACTSQSEGQEFEELQDWAAFGRCAVFCCAQN